VLHRAFFLPPALEVAPLLLGTYCTVSSEEGAVTIRITETEAYHGLGTAGVRDEGAHAKNGKTARNASMFGPPGHAYVYFTYGMHYAINFVTSPEGVASGCLIRSGEVVSGHALARHRRILKRGGNAQHDIPDVQLARGPGNLAAALGVERATHDGRDLLTAPFALEPGSPPKHIAQGPRVGVSGIAGGPAFPWRFWEHGAASVSAFRPGKNVPRT